MNIRLIKAEELKVCVKRDGQHEAKPWLNRAGEMSLDFTVPGISSVRVNMWVTPAAWERDPEKIRAAAALKLRDRLQVLLAKIRPTPRKNPSRKLPGCWPFASTMRTAGVFSSSFSRSSNFRWEAASENHL